MTSSIERDVENAIADALTTAGVTGVNIYTSERTSGRLLPFVSIVASIKSEEIAPFTGVFDLNATITYVARADTISDQAYDQKFASIQQAFYTNPNLASQMTSAQSDLEFYIADITRIGQRIISTSRTWARDVFMDIKATTIQSSIPTDGLSLWLKSDSGVTLDGSDVTAWEDQSGNGNSANATASDPKPIFSSSSINSKPAVLFRDSSWMLIPSNSIGSDANITIFCALRNNVLQTETKFLLKKGDSEFYENEVWGLAFVEGFGFLKTNEESWDFSVYTIPASLSILTAISNSGQSSIFRNGTLVGNPPQTTGVEFPNSSSQPIGIGASNNGTYGGIDADIAEIIIYNRALITEERQQVEAYLNTKYAIY